MNEAQRDLIRDVYITFVQGDSGKRVLEAFRRTIGDVDTFDPESPYATAHNEGKRSVYLWIMRKLEQADNPEVWKEGPVDEPEPETEV